MEYQHKCNFSQTLISPQVTSISSGPSWSGHAENWHNHNYGIGKPFCAAQKKKKKRPDSFESRTGSRKKVAQFEKGEKIAHNTARTQKNSIWQRKFRDKWTENSWGRAEKAGAWETSLKEGNVAQVLSMCTLISPRVKKVRCCWKQKKWSTSAHPTHIHLCVL